MELCAGAPAVYHNPAANLLLDKRTDPGQLCEWTVLRNKVENVFRPQKREPPGPAKGTHQNTGALLCFAREQFGGLCVAQLSTSPAEFARLTCGHTSDSKQPQRWSRA